MTTGWLASFTSAAELRRALTETRRAGFRCFEAYTPYPVEGLEEALDFHETKVALLALIGGVLGGGGGFFMQWFADVVHYPINVGGRPDFSWPAFIPVTFELTVLGAALFAAFGMLALNRLPQPYHPLFAIDEFRRASKDRFFLFVSAKDPHFGLASTRRFLESLFPESVHEVPSP